MSRPYVLISECEYAELCKIREKFESGNIIDLTVHKFGKIKVNGEWFRVPFEVHDEIKKLRKQLRTKNKK